MCLEVLLNYNSKKLQMTVTLISYYSCFSMDHQTSDDPVKLTHFEFAYTIVIISNYRQMKSYRAIYMI